MTAGLEIENRSLTVIVLAAGQGKRMRSTLPKVLHPMLGRSMLGHVLAAAAEATASEATASEPAASEFTAAGASLGGRPARTMVVVGNGAQQVREHLKQVAPQARTVLQEQQLGTGHAVRVALNELGELTGTVVVLSGDTPLLRAGTIRDLIAAHEAAGASGTVLTSQVVNPYGLGRIIRSESDGAFQGIVEERDATDRQRQITEINGGVYAFDGEVLCGLLEKLSCNNDQGEEYLTDVFGLMIDAGLPVATHQAADWTETLGANDRAQVAGLRAMLRDRVNHSWLLAGVTIIDPATTWIDVTVQLGPDVLVEPGTQLLGTTRVEREATVGPDTTIADSTIGAGATVFRAHVVGATVAERASVGPFVFLDASGPGDRPGGDHHDDGSGRAGEQA